MIGYFDWAQGGLELTQAAFGQQLSHPVSAKKFKGHVV